VQVVPAPPALLRVASVSVDDDALPPSAGNGNGSTDAGEIIELDVVLQNTGGSDAIGVTALLSSPDSSVVVLQGGFDVAELLAADSLDVTDSLRVQIASWVPDGTRITLPLQLNVAGDSLQAAAQFQDAVRFTVQAPRIEVTRVRAIPGATTQLEVELKNYGSGEATSLQATLLADPPVTVLEDSAGAAGIAPWSSTTFGPLFEIDASGGNGSGVTLSGVDAQGRGFTHSVDLVPPAPPVNLVADQVYTPGTMRLLWDAPPDTDLAGYQVFRAVLGGEFERISLDMIVHRDFRDPTAQLASQYAYYVVAVDASRQWSAPSETLQVITQVALQPGWPLPLEAATSSSVGIGDIDADGAPEIVVAADNVLYAWHGEGMEVLDGDADTRTIGVFNTSVGAASASVALANLDGASGLEIVVASWATNTVHVLRADGTSMPGWPQQPSNGGTPGFWASPAVGDVNGDGLPEIVAVSKNGYLYAWHADGSPLIPATNGAVRLVGSWTQNTPALADLDGDGASEIIVASSLGYLHVITWSGVDYPGWPKNIESAMTGSPAVGDVDGDGTLEIVETSIQNKLHVLRPDGTYLPGFPVSNVPSRPPDLGSSIALGDLNGDGKLEIVLVAVPQTSLSATELRVYNWQGALSYSKPLGNVAHSSPILADLDGDGGPDVLIGGDTGVLYAWDANGNGIAGFPVPLGVPIGGTPTYADVNQDGIGDVVFAGAEVYVWSMPGAYAPEHAPWPTFHGDMQRRGIDPPYIPTPVTPESVPVPARLAVQLAPNPFNPRLTLRLAIPAESGSAASSARGTQVRVDLYDARGHRVRRLVDRPLPAGWHTEVWDGRDDGGRELSSGVYFYAVRAAGTQATGKVTLLR
jgi:hypothetical protein